MALRLPTISARELASHNSEKSCYVTVGANVYDVTSFLDIHPGGGDLILKYGGKDVSEIMGDELSHVHSDAAYEILNDNRIGFVGEEATTESAVDRPEDIVPMLPNAAGMKAPKSQGLIFTDQKRPVFAATGLSGVKALKSQDVMFTDQKRPVFAATGLSGVDDLKKETDLDADYQTLRFLDLNKPLLLQVWNGGFSKDFYLEQVHRPRYYARGSSAPLFGNFLEPLSRTTWYSVPIVWLPPALYCTFLAYQGGISLAMTAAYWLIGFLSWAFTEYIVHRAICHMDKYLPDNRIAITAHFIIHGLHHYLPQDRYRTATPPSYFLLLATPVYRLVHSIFFWDWYAALAVFCGWLVGYVYYEIIHFALHTMKYVNAIPLDQWRPNRRLMVHGSLPSLVYMKKMKKYHLQHHYADYENGFGITTPFWDRVFGTEFAPNPAPRSMSRSWGGS